MRFEWDPAKSEANKGKHGIDFEEAQEVWLDEQALDWTASERGEIRHARIGKALGRLWFCVYTQRGESIRLISVRRARKGEEKAYGQAAREPGNHP